MARLSKNPILLDYCKSISISDLARMGFLRQNSTNINTVIWKKKGVETASITLTVNLYTPRHCFAEFSYSCTQGPIEYRVQMEALPSNLGKGKLWYFICPRTGKRCRKLHFLEGYFLHRSAFPSALYELQTWSKEDRYEATKPIYRSTFAEIIYDELYSNNFKKTYKGKLTKRYKMVLKKLQKLGEIINNDLY
jgi:hypothetical protein